jgi:hypothetical protein
MSKHTLRHARPAGQAGQSAVSRGSRLIEAVRAVRLAAVALSFGSRFVPLGDNRELLAELSARARMARDFGA